MKKIFSLIILGLFVILMVGGVSAYTLVAGKILNEDYTPFIGGAEVTVTCNEHIKTTTSLDDGSYAVTYLETGDEGCDTGDEVMVLAESQDKTLSGSGSGIVKDKDEYPGVEINLAIIDVTVPEFGFIVGLVTILGAVGVFFFVRKE